MAKLKKLTEEPKEHQPIGRPNTEKVLATPGCDHINAMLLRRDRVVVTVKTESGKKKDESWVTITCLNCNALMLPKELYHILDKMHTAQVAEKMGLNKLAGAMKKDAPEVKQ